MLFAASEYGRIRSLRDPAKKMSKSDPDEKSRICLTDTPDIIARNIKKAVTDFQSEVFNMYSSFFFKRVLDFR